MSVIKTGQILEDAQVITAQQREHCTGIAAGDTAAFRQCLIETQGIAPEAIAQSLAVYMGVPFVEKITDKMADLNVLAKIPLKFLRENVVMPVVVEGQTVILTADPFQFQPIDDLNMLLGGTTTTAIATTKMIADGINRYYPIEGTKQMIEELAEEEKETPEAVDFESIGDQDIETMAEEAPIIKLVNHILFQAVKQGASDIHIEPYEKELVVRYRVDGVLYQVMTPPKRTQGALTSRIKIMANLNIAEKRIPQDGRIEIRVGGKSIDIRVSVLPVAHGERIVMRLLDKSRSIAKLADMGFSERDYRILTEAIHKPNGIIYVTGPTGSGKTTTLYAILSELNKPEVNIVTVEDPVEYQMPGIGQVQVREKVGLTFAAALRSILRQDPDIIMIGETRDFETAQIATQAALTGHLVLSTLHTNSAPASITRLLDMGVEPYLIGSSLILAVAQRLVRKLCPKCKQTFKPSADLLKSIGLTPAQAKGITFYEAVGCEECSEKGYKGRLPLYEIMQMSGEVARLTMERADTNSLRRAAVKDGMTLLLDDGIAKIKLGLTTIEEVLTVASTEFGVDL